MFFNRIKKPKKLIFDHLPKCGGTSLHRFLELQYSKRRIFTIDGSNPETSTLDFKQLTEKQRYKFNLIKGHLANEIFEYVNPKCLKVTILREPIDRIVSHYFFVKRRKNHYLHEEVITKDLSLKEYAESDLSDELRNWYVQHFSGMSSTEVMEKPELALESAKIGLAQYDLIGFLDEYELFMKRLISLANLQKELKLSVHNRTENRPRLDQITSETVEVIKSVNNLDCELYQWAHESN
jgi:hypothetical protein